MIHLETKRYHIVLWETEDRSGSAAALKLEFDSRAEASAAFEAEQQLGRYAAGILFQWLKDSDDWQLMDRFPRT